MKIQLRKNINTLPNRQQNISFKRGLTEYEIDTVKKMGPTEYKDITSSLQSQYGIQADVGGSNTAAFCLDSVCKIMHRAGFKLPKKFRFAPLDRDRLGQYSTTSDEVTINSNYSEFNNLERQNKLEESQSSFHPQSRHFLESYIHEFSHAAHFKNILSQQGTDGYTIFWDKLNNHKPNQILKDPMIAFMKSIQGIPGQILLDMFPPEIGWYSMTNLNEYFAEKNSYMLAEQLGDNFSIDNVEKDFASSYKGFPADWDIQKQRDFIGIMRRGRQMTWGIDFVIPGGGALARCYANHKIANIFDQDIKYMDGEVWNGNIDNLKSKSLIFQNEQY